MTNKHMGSNFDDFLEEEGIKEEVEELAKKRLRELDENTEFISHDDMVDRFKDENISLVNRVFEQTLKDFYKLYFSHHDPITVTLENQIAINMKGLYQSNEYFAKSVDIHVRAIMEIIEGE